MTNWEKGVSYITDRVIAAIYKELLEIKIKKTRNSNIINMG